MALYDPAYGDHGDNTGRDTKFRRLKGIKRLLPPSNIRAQSNRGYRSPAAIATKKATASSTSSQTTSQITCLAAIRASLFTFSRCIRCCAAAFVQDIKPYA